MTIVLIIANIPFTHLSFRETIRQFVSNVYSFIVMRVFAGFRRLSGDRRGNRAGKNGGNKETEGHH